MKVFVPPIKSQGIKTKLVNWISSNIEDIQYDRWVEPFMGTGVVAFNVRPQKALLCDSNPHLIRFYNALKDKEITSGIVRKYLTEEGTKLLDSNGEYYYEVRYRFNLENNPLDFLFLSRSCFNGMMRFNKKGGFNVPFCKKPNRFAQALVTKITNQVGNITQIIENGDYTFILQDFKETNRSAVYEALLSSIELKDSISNTEMKSRIVLNESQLTTKEKKYEIPVQLTMSLEEQKRFYNLNTPDM